MTEETGIIDLNDKKTELTFLDASLLYPSEKGRLCYNECSRINPALAGLCDRLEEYFKICRTNIRLNGGGNR